MHKLRHDDKDREKHYEEIAKLLHDNRVKEAELLKALREAEEKKVFALFLFLKGDWHTCNCLLPIT